MECPKCGNTKFKIDKTVDVGNGKSRSRRCIGDDELKGCGLVFHTYEEITTVVVFNPSTIQGEHVDIKDYKSKHVYSELKGKSGFQQRMFRE